MLEANSAPILSNPPSRYPQIAPEPAQEPKIPGHTDDDDLYAYTPLLLNKTDQKHGTDEI
jgi:hypothetical protein